MNDEIREALKLELIYQSMAIDKPKDIIIVVHNQLQHVRQCIESVKQHTKLYQLWIWDNNSTDGTREYLKSLENINLFLHDTNIGFIEPNNIISQKCNSEYIILLNSDTIVRDGWDLSLLGYLQNNPNTKQVGYMGGLLDAEGYGCGIAYGENIDYVMGWCCCFELATCVPTLFDSAFHFAYFEDADLSLRIKSKGYSVYGLHLRYVDHFGNITARSISESLLPILFNNQKVFFSKWGKYLEKDRILTKISKALPQNCAIM